MTEDSSIKPTKEEKTGGEKRQRMEEKWEKKCTEKTEQIEQGGKKNPRKTEAEKGNIEKGSSFADIQLQSSGRAWAPLHPIHQALENSLS